MASRGGQCSAGWRLGDDERTGACLLPADGEQGSQGGSRRRGLADGSSTARRRRGRAGKQKGILRWLLVAGERTLVAGGRWAVGRGSRRGVADGSREQEAASRMGVASRGVVREPWGRATQWISA